jgi:putative transposase
VLAIKTVKQNYIATSEVLALLEEFRKMINDCIRIGLSENTTSRNSLSSKAYHQLERYDVSTRYRLTAISKVAGILRNYRRDKRKNPNVERPFARKPMLTDCYAFKIIEGKLRIKIKNNEFIFIPLNQHTLESISSHGVRSVTLTPSTISISFSKEITMTEPKGLIGLDTTSPRAGS